MVQRDLWNAKTRGTHLGFSCFNHGGGLHCYRMKWSVDQENQVSQSPGFVFLCHDGVKRQLLEFESDRSDCRLREPTMKTIILFLNYLAPCSLLDHRVELCEGIFQEFRLCEESQDAPCSASPSCVTFCISRRKNHSFRTSSHHQYL